MNQEQEDLEQIINYFKKKKRQSYIHKLLFPNCAKCKKQELMIKNARKFLKDAKSEGGSDGNN